MNLLLRSLINKISIFIISSLLFALTVSALLNYFNFDQSYKDAMRSNFNIIAEDAVATIESGLDMGLKPEEIKNIQKILDALCLNNSNVKLITVFNNKKEILYKSGTEKTPLDFLNWEICSIKNSKEIDIICLPIHNSFKIPVGYLALKYSAIGSDNPVKNMGLYLAKLLTVTILISSLIIFLGVSLIFSKLVSKFKKMDIYISNNTDNSDNIPEQITNFKTISESLISDLNKIEESVDIKNV